MAVVLGVRALFAGGPMVLLEDGGWPWNGSSTHWPGTDRARSEVVRRQRQVETFEGTHDEVSPGARGGTRDSKREYGLDATIAVGRALVWTAVVLVSTGVAILVGVPIARRVRRRPIRCDLRPARSATRPDAWWSG